MGLFKKKQEGPIASVPPAEPILKEIQDQIAKQEPERNALVVGIELLPDNEFAFKIIANYPLKFGNCTINQ